MSSKRKNLSQLASGKRRRKSNEDEPSSQTDSNVKPGTIVRMNLKNFMCHDHLEVKFRKNINYVIGQNGSGKSAILTALVVGLGGKASLTNRGNSIKGFIKNGKTGGSVEITLSNVGQFRYRHDTFGKEITIIRTFKDNGSSSYKIKSASGETISTSSRDIRQISMQLNIQVDNPICLLNQDTSRNFLSTSDPHQKFILFMRATRLEELKDGYKKVSNNLTVAVRALKEKKRCCDELGNKVNQLKIKYDNCKQITNLKTKINDLQKEFLWSRVRDAEVEADQHEQSTKVLQEEVTRIQNHIGDNSRNTSSSTALIQSLQAQIYEVQASIEDQNNPQNILVRTLGELKESLIDKKREKRVVEKDIALKSGNCVILEQEITKIVKNFSVLEEGKMKRLEEIASTEEQIQGIKSLLETSKNDQFQSINSWNRIREEEKNLSSELAQIKSQIEHTNSRLNSLKGQSNNNLSIYDPSMVKVVDAINASRSKFKEMPRGPLGSYIKLKDKKWAVAVEGFFGKGVLSAFAVDNINDNRILLQIFDKYWTSRFKPMVITSKFFNQVHNVSKHFVQSSGECVNLYSILEISDPVVTNCLIDQSGMESVLLIPNTETAMELMSDSRNVPKNCSQGITIKGDKYFPDPNYKTYCSRYHHAQFLQVSVEDIIKQLQNKLNELNDKKQTVSNQQQSVEMESQKQSKVIKELEIKVTRLKSALMRLQITFDNLKNIDEPDVESVNVMKNELAELKKIIEQRNIVSQKITEDVTELTRKVANKEEKLSKITSVVRGYEERIEGLNKQLQDQITKQNEYEVNKRFEQKRLETAMRRLQSAKADLRGKENVVQECAAEAAAFGVRPNEIRKVPVIMKEIENHKKIIRKIESGDETIEELLTKYQTSMELYEKTSDTIKSLKHNVELLRDITDKRHRHYEHSEDFYVTFVKLSFQKVLEFRQFQGNLEIDMDEKKLDLIVIPQHGSQGITTTTNLSGGERSFSTVAFLYALWQCVDFPFYFLDEFDVFMDKVNRTKIMEILLHHAKSSPTSQFVFLTPQDVSFVNDKDVEIHRLANPERGASEM